MCSASMRRIVKIESYVVFAVVWSGDIVRHRIVMVTYRDTAYVIPLLGI